MDKQLKVLLDQLALTYAVSSLRGVSLCYTDIADADDTVEMGWIAEVATKRVAFRGKAVRVVLQGFGRSPEDAVEDLNKSAGDPRQYGG